MARQGKARDAMRCDGMGRSGRAITRGRPIRARPVKREKCAMTRRRQPHVDRNWARLGPGAGGGAGAGAGPCAALDSWTHSQRQVTTSDDDDSTLGAKLKLVVAARTLLIMNSHRLLVGRSSAARHRPAIVLHRRPPATLYR
ncbi:Hypothetical predicted protein, partial [Olea europaea subsp. europaea]